MVNHNQCGACLEGFMEEDKARTDGISKPCAVTAKIPEDQESVEKQICTPTIDLSAYWGEDAAVKALVQEVQRVMVGPDAPGFMYVTGLERAMGGEGTIKAAQDTMRSFFELDYLTKAETN